MRREIRRRRCWIIFPKTSLLIIDESHATVPQIGGMYEGDFPGNARSWIMASGCRPPSTTVR